MNHTDARVTLLTVPERTSYKAVILVDGKAIMKFQGLTQEHLTAIENGIHDALEMEDDEKCLS